jgi:hypothetical protein
LADQHGDPLVVRPEVELVPSSARSSGISEAAQTRCPRETGSFSGSTTVFARAPQELLRVVEEILVEGVRQGDQAVIDSRPARPTRPERCQVAIMPPGSRPDAGVEAADVDPHLQGRGRDDAVDGASEEVGLDLPPLLGEETGAVVGNAGSELRLRRRSQE